MLDIQHHQVPNHDGWNLQLRQARHRTRHNPALAPIAIIPGYGMNSFLFGFHPRGTSMELCLAEAGFEVWSLNLRAQGGSRATSPAAEPPSFAAFAGVDLPAGVEFISRNSASTGHPISLIGCSLGGTIAYTYLALHPQQSRVGAVVTIGSPIHWDRPPLLFKLLGVRPDLIERLKLRGTRSMVRAALPLLQRLPRLAHVYLNPAHVDLHALHELAHTVENPQPRLNRELSEWLAAGTLTVRGRDIAEEIRKVTVPLLVTRANRDGIVPTDSVSSVCSRWGGRADELVVGTPEDWYSHAEDHF
jgi:pimeloyl-ACP methyl ester carboxylesterase